MKHSQTIERIRKLFGLTGWSIYRLAQESGVPESTCRRVIRGECDPSTGTAEQILEPLTKWAESH